MAIEFRYSLGGDSVLPCLDFDIDATYTNPKKGDLVKLNANGKVVKAAPGDTAVLGVSEGPYFEGLENPPKRVKVRTSPLAVYEIPYVGTTKTSLTDADIGAVFDIDANQNLNLDDTANGFLKVVGYNNEKKTAYVQITNLIYN